VRAVIEPAQLIIAHNATFDRPMVEKLWPIFEQKHWACSFIDIDWKAEGLGSAKLDYLLMKAGWFHDGHRALSDALATVFLLTLPLPVTGRSGLKALLDCARRPLWAVRAEDTAFEQRAALKARNYRWDDLDRRSEGRDRLARGGDLPGADRYPRHQDAGHNALFSAALVRVGGLRAAPSPSRPRRLMHSRRLTGTPPHRTQRQAP
jgi:hypothetical protein